ncbi:MAG TPA: mechanosensitive ion channel family protein [Bacteroidia bacterium]|nr:mechanosensitive ion channel family protein [Bacteroidia bacterium]
MKIEINTIMRILAFSSLGMLLGKLIEKYLLSILKSIAKEKKLHFDDALVAVLRRVLTFLFLLSGFSLSVNLYARPYAEKYHINSICLSLLILIITTLSARIFTMLIQNRTTASSTKTPSTSIILNITRIITFLIGAMLIMQIFGISITPILTAFGVGGIAIALALQETLSNLFSGIQLLASRHIRKGDYIKLGSGESGYIQDITWRNMILRELPNNIIVIPNSKASTSVITNYNLPEPEGAVLVEVCVCYDSALQEVENITIQIAKKVMTTTKGAVKTHEPFIRYHTFADSGIQFSVILRGDEYSSQFLIKHEFIKALHTAYRQHNIEMTLPKRDIFIRNLNALKN